MNSVMSSYFSFYVSDIGKLLLASNGTHLTGLWIEGQKHYAATMPDYALEKNDLPLFIQTKEWLDRYFQKQNPSVTEIPLQPQGSDFRRQVWTLLCDIPYGRVISYAQLADKLTQQSGKKTSPRAVGCAVGHNPISIIIPCHRVIGSNGKLTGYAAGLGIKQKLLEQEGITAFFDGVPPIS